MYIEKIEINNFRNLDGIKMNFDSKMNFIVGENNLGKSNLLDCLNTVFNYSRFKEDDFFNPEEKNQHIFNFDIRKRRNGDFR